MSPSIAVHEIMELAMHGDIFVNRKKLLHVELRKKCRRLYKRGELEFVSNEEKGFTYRATEFGRSRHLHNQLKKALRDSQSQE